MTDITNKCMKRNCYSMRKESDGHTESYKCDYCEEYICSVGTCNIGREINSDKCYYHKNGIDPNNIIRIINGNPYFL